MKKWMYVVGLIIYVFLTISCIIEGNYIASMFSLTIIFVGAALYFAEKTINSYKEMDGLKEEIMMEQASIISIQRQKNNTMEKSIELQDRIIEIHEKEILFLNELLSLYIEEYEG